MSSEKPKILVIDDEQDLCFLLSSMLSGYGYETFACHTLESGMKSLSGIGPDWIILDNDLPDGRGWEKAPEILSQYPAIRIINISANPDSEKSLQSSRVHYLIKPIAADTIVRILQERY